MKWATSGFELLVHLLRVCLGPGGYFGKRLGITALVLNFLGKKKKKKKNYIKYCYTDMLSRSYRN